MRHYLALEDGTVHTIPQRNDFGDPAQLFSGVPAFVDIDGGAARGVGLAADGDVWSWGPDNGRPDATSGPPGQMSFPVPIVQIDVDGFALGDDGSVFGWGANIYGVNDGDVLGAPNPATDDPEPIESPARIPGLSDIVDISGGPTRAAAVTSSGEVLTWGIASNCVLGRLGPNGCDAVSGNRLAIGAVPGLEAIIDVNLEQNSAYAVDRDGAIFTWGSIFGRGFDAPAQVPTLLDSYQSPDGISGLSQGLVLLVDGNVLVNDPVSTGSFTAFEALPFVNAQGLASDASNFFGGAIIGGVYTGT